VKKRFFGLILTGLSTFIALVPSQTLAVPENLERWVRMRVRNYMNQNEVPGAAVALYCRGKSSIYSFDVNENSIFELASISKVFASSLLAREVAQGNIHLDDSISKFLRELPPRDGRARAVDQITLKHLATHTASLPRGGASDMGMSNRELMKMLSQWEAPYPIGTQKSYSNFGFGLLSQVLEDSSLKTYGEAMSFETMLRNRILKPLQMRDTMVSVPEGKRNRYLTGTTRNGNSAPHYSDHPVWAGGGGLRSTIVDMSRFLEANLGVAGSSELVQALQLAQTQVEISSDISAALGWDVHPIQEVPGRPQLVSKNGSNQGFSTFMAFVPTRKMGMVLLTNKSAANPGKVIKQMIQKLLRDGDC
jgi:beta-lactamase class C